MECCPSAPTCASLVHTLCATDCREYFHFAECVSTRVICCVVINAWRWTRIVSAHVQIILVVCTSITDVAPTMIFTFAHFIEVAATVTWTTGCSVEQADNYFYYLERDGVLFTTSLPCRTSITEAASETNFDFAGLVEAVAFVMWTTGCLCMQADNYFYYAERDGALAITSSPFSF